MTAKHPSDEISLDNVHDVVRYHRPTDDQVQRHERLAEASELLLTTILENCPESSDRIEALKHVRMAKMLASAAVALEPASNGDSVTIIINCKEFLTVDGTQMSYEDICKLAYGRDLLEGANPSMTYRAPHGANGILAPGERIRVGAGFIFNVISTSNA